MQDYILCMIVWLHNQEARGSLWDGWYIAKNIPYKQNIFACGGLPVHMHGHAHVDM